MTVNLNKTLLPDAATALPGREQAIELENRHYVTGRPIMPPFPEPANNYPKVLLALGCFWGAERKFWQTEGVYTTAVGYTSGLTPNPAYEEVCTGRTGHTEAVLVVFDPEVVTFQQLLKTFFEAHDPTQGMRQGNDIGSQYRSGIYVYDEAQQQAAESALASYQQALDAAALHTITTEVLPAGDFYYAEQYHQQYLAKNPNGYCGLGGTGVTCPI